MKQSPRSLYYSTLLNYLTHLAGIRYKRLREQLSSFSIYLNSSICLRQVLREPQSRSPTHLSIFEQGPRSSYHPMLLDSPISHLPSIQYQNSRKNPPGSNPNTLIYSTELSKPHSHSQIHLNNLICHRQLSRRSHTILTT